MSRDTIVGLFTDQEHAERGIRQLQAAGFSFESIAVGISRETTRQSGRGVPGDGVLVMVRSGARGAEARAILEQNDATIDAAAADTGAGGAWPGSDRRNPTRRGRRRTDAEDRVSRP